MASSAASTAGTANADSDGDVAAPHQLERRISQAIDEGHDADIPSNAGYVLDEKGERRRRQSIAERQKSAKKSDLIDSEKGAPGGRAGDDDDDANIVWWDGPDDPENPYNWSGWKKTVNIGLVSCITFISPLGSCKFASFHLVPVPQSPFAILCNWAR